MFWTNSTINLIITLLGVSLVRILVRRALPRLNDHILDIYLVVVFFTGFYIAWIDHNLTEESLRKLETSLREAEQKIKDVDERESLRQWAMVVLTGEIATDRMGLHLRSAGTLTKRYQEIFIRDESKGIIKSEGCRKEPYTEYIDKLKSLIKDYPKVPYAYGLLALCLKEHNDPSWKTEAERAIQVLEKLIVIQPHVSSIDGMYGFISRDLLGLDVGKTGFFDVYENEVYVPIGVPH
jgi:hypothetical protein